MCTNTSICIKTKKKIFFLKRLVNFSGQLWWKSDRDRSHRRWTNTLRFKVQLSVTFGKSGTLQTVLTGNNPHICEKSTQGESLTMLVTGPVQEVQDHYPTPGGTPRFPSPVCPRVPTQLPDAYLGLSEKKVWSRHSQKGWLLPHVGKLVPVAFFCSGVLSPSVLSTWSLEKHGSRTCSF